jgi:hypothetical protein
MHFVRGIFMLAAAAIVFWKAWEIHHGPQFWLACALGVVALGMAVWHFTRQPEPPKSLPNSR